MMKAILETGWGKAIEILTKYFKRKNMEYILERHNQHLTYVYNKYSQATFNCL